MIGSLRSQFLAALTILMIAGTMTSCGRYGSPVRPPSESPPPEALTSSVTAVQWEESSSALGITDAKQPGRNED